MLDISAYAGSTVPLDATPQSFGKYGTSYLYRTEIALLHASVGSLVAYDPQPPYGAHESSEVKQPGAWPPSAGSGRSA